MVAVPPSDSLFTSLSPSSCGRDMKGSRGDSPSPYSRTLYSLISLRKPAFLSSPRLIRALPRETNVLLIRSPATPSTYLRSSLRPRLIVRSLFLVRVRPCTLSSPSPVIFACRRPLPGKSCPRHHRRLQQRWFSRFSHGPAISQALAILDTAQPDFGSRPAPLQAPPALCRILYDLFFVEE